jgi:hypothetical protein
MTTIPSNPTPPRTLDEQMELYIDGLLSPGETVSFEAVMRGDAALRARVAEARAADQAVRAVFAVPDITMRVPEDLAVASRAASAMPSPGVVGQIGDKPVPWWVTVASLAATLAITVGAWMWMNRTPGPQYITPDEVYGRLVQKGFKPEFVCTTDAEFRKAVDDRFGQPLLIASSPDIQLLGWAYSNSYSGLTLGEKCFILMANVKGKPSLLFMDNKSEDRRLKVAKDSALHLHRGVIGTMVVYELSPFETPELLPRTYNPDAGGPPQDPADSDQN